MPIAVQLLAGKKLTVRAVADRLLDPLGGNPHTIRNSGSAGTEAGGTWSRSAPGDHSR